MSNITVFINHVGQTILAEQIEDKASKLTVKNPAVLHVTPSQTGQLQVQLIPLFFKEFIDQKTRNEGAQFTFSKDSIVTSSVNLEPKIEEQYNRIFSPAPRAASNDGKDAPTIKLFDE